MIHPKKRLLSALLGVLLVAGAAAPTAWASGQEAFATHYGPLYSGDTYINTGIYHSSFTGIDGSSDGTAYAGVWIALANGSRVSAAAYCSTPGCVAIENWYGPYPNGHPAIHNHGNASPSYFDATDAWR